MKIVTLMENTACREDLAREHGLSLYIEAAGHRILFDAGQSGAFAGNAETLKIDLAKVDFAVLSHGHYDHGDGLAHFWKINPTAPVYLSRHAFEPHYNARGRYIGLAPELRGGPLVFTGDFTEIAPGITLHTCNDRPRPYPADPFGLTCGENRQPEDFRHEQYLCIREGEKTVCFSGCSHKGILNIAAWFRPDVMVGGFHFMKLEDKEKLTEAARILLQFPTVYYTGHCTGAAQFAHMKAIMGERLQSIPAGTVWEL